ncbi:MAG: prolyl oligopeptidase family serine peptidase, partial [Bdellovibrionales bacterium]|nr:prolyl oligopeptidase family serine peptidase [Bdellovibrionales bacterium]
SLKSVLFQLPNAVSLLCDSFQAPSSERTYTFASSGALLVDSINQTSSIDPLPDAALLRTNNETPVPITLLPPSDVHKKYPVLFVSYGLYGKTLTPQYRPMWNILRQHGVGIAIAHIRGGGFYGPQWHEAGRGQNRLKAVNDVENAAQYLKAQHPRIVAYGKSAGGWPILQALLKNPSLFDAAILDSPIVDPIRQITSQDRFYSLEDYEWKVSLGAKLYPEQKSVTKHAQFIRSIPVYLRWSSQDSLILSEPLVHWIEEVKSSKSSPIRLILDTSDSASHLGETLLDKQIQSEARQVLFILSR